jgi:hypothetical protein
MFSIAKTYRCLLKQSFPSPLALAVKLINTAPVQLSAARSLAKL